MMKFIARTVLAVALFFATAARADHVAIDFSATSPAAVTTAVGATSATQIGMFVSCSFVATVQGGTGGTLDIYVQTFFKSAAGGFWVDVAHLPQVAAGAAVATFAFTLTRWSPTTSAVVASLNTVSGTPALAVNTVVPGILGYQLRTVYKTGAGNTVGAAQTILATCSST
jgi:hypothetical protein